MEYWSGDTGRVGVSGLLLQLKNVVRQSNRPQQRIRCVGRRKQRLNGNVGFLRIPPLQPSTTPIPSRLTPVFRSSFCISFRCRTGKGRSDLLLELPVARRV